MPVPCDRGQRLRNGVCCRSTICTDQGFNPCHKNNGTDVCVPCPKDHFVEGNYSTGVFEYHPCAERPACQQEQIRNEKGHCVCDRSKQYINGGFIDGICKRVRKSCPIKGIELDNYGNCSRCKRGYYKDTNSNAVCKRKGNPVCTDNQIINEGNTTTDRHCLPKQYSQITTTLNTDRTTIQTNGSSGQNAALTIGVCFGGLLLLLVVVVSIYIFRSKTKRNVDKKREEGGVKGGVELEDLGNLHRNSDTESVQSELEERQSLNKCDDRESVDESCLNTLSEVPISYESGKYTKDGKLEALPFNDNELRPRQPEDDVTQESTPIVNPTSDNQDHLLSRAEGGIDLGETRSEDDHIVARTLYRRSGGTVVIEHAQVHTQEQTVLPLTSPVNDDNGRLVNGPRSIPMPPRVQSGVIPGGGQHHAGNNAQPDHVIQFLQPNPQGAQVVDDLSSGPYSPIR